MRAARIRRQVPRDTPRAKRGRRRKGRQAELYWPDDNLWYLVEIQNVNLRSKKATIAYTTGEVEELDLPEIIKDGHMSLITK